MALQTALAVVFSPLENIEGERRVDPNEEEEYHEREEKNASHLSTVTRKEASSFSSWWGRLVRRYMQESPPLIQTEMPPVVGVAEPVAPPHPSPPPLPSSSSFSSIGGGAPPPPSPPPHVWASFLSDDDRQTAIELDAAVRHWVVEDLGDLLGWPTPTPTTPSPTACSSPVHLVPEEEEYAALGCWHPSPHLLASLLALTHAVLDRWRHSPSSPFPRRVEEAWGRSFFSVGPPLGWPALPHETDDAVAEYPLPHGEVGPKVGQVEGDEGSPTPLHGWVAVHLVRALCWMEFYTELTHVPPPAASSLPSSHPPPPTASPWWGEQVISTHAVALAWQVSEDAAALLYTISLRLPYEALVRYLFWNKAHLCTRSEQDAEEDEAGEESSESSEEEEEDSDTVL